MSRIVLHIGMPKTGTTTLQADVFPLISQKSNFNYIGLRQPARKIKQHPLMSALFRWFVHGDSFSQITELVDRNSSESPLLISNEMILSSSIVSDWSVRVERVAKLFNEYNTDVYLTVRDPAQAILSYYVEHYLDAPTGHFARFADAVQKDARLQIYRYAWSIPFIQSVFDRQLVVEAYENVFSGKSAFLSSLVHDGQAFPGALGRHNTKCERGNEIMVGRHRTLRDALRMTLYSTVLGQSRTARNVIAALHPVTRALDWIKLRPTGVTKPSQAEMANLRLMLKEDITYLKEHIGIDYSA